MAKKINSESIKTGLDKAGTIAQTATAVIAAVGSIVSVITAASTKGKK